MNIDELPSVNNFTGERSPPRIRREQENPLFVLAVIIIVLLLMVGFALAYYFGKPIREKQALMLDEVRFQLDDDRAYILLDSYSRESDVLLERCAPAAKARGQAVFSSYEVSSERPTSWGKYYACLFEEHGFPTVVWCERGMCYTKHRKRVFRFHKSVP